MRLPMPPMAQLLHSSRGVSAVSSLVVGLGQCGNGKYGDVSTGTCTNCPMGVYGNSTGLTSPACSGPCNGGRFGSSGQTGPNCNGACSPGKYCPVGSSASSVCPVGQWSGQYAVTCTVCPPDRPYSLVGSGDMANCTACASGCEAGLHGATLCPNVTALSWTAWYDVGGAEGNNSCLLMNASGLPVTTAPSLACAASGLGAHLLTSAQVGCCCCCRPHRLLLWALS